MAEKKLSGLSGTPWHVGYVTKKEDDPRRHRGRCVYYNSEKKSCILNGRCFGSAHCQKYRDNKLEKEKQKEKRDNISWKTQSKYVRDPYVVQARDEVEVYCFNDQKEYRLRIGETNDTQAPLAKLCLTRRVNYLFSYNGFRYKIKRIIKWTDKSE